MSEIERLGEVVTMAGGEARFLGLDLEPGEFLHAVVEQHGIDVALRLVEPGGATVVRIDSPTGAHGSEELVAIAPAGGRYRLVIEALDGEGVRGEVVLRPPERRPATDEDRAAVAADGAYREGRDLIRSGRYDRAIERLKEALEVFRRRGWGVRKALALDALGVAHEQSGELQAAADSCETALALYRGHGHGHMAPRLLDRVGWLRLRLGRAGEAVESLSEAVDLFSSSAAEPGCLALALAHLGTARLAAGDGAQAQDEFERAIAAAGDDELVRARVLANYGAYLLGIRRPRAALEAYRGALEVFRRHGRGLQLALTLSGLAAAALEVGEVADGESAIGEALERFVGPGDRRDRAVALNTLGNLRRRGGDLGAARAAYDEALDLARAAGDRAIEAVVLLDLGHLEAVSGEPQRGLALIDRAEAHFVALGEPVRERIARARAAEVLRDLGRLAEALERLEPVLDLVEAQPAATAADLPGPASGVRPEHLAIAVDVLLRLDAVEPERGHRSRALELDERRRRMLEADARRSDAALHLPDPGRPRALETRARAYDPIEPPAEPREPVNPAHTDLPGPGQGGGAVHSPALDAAGARSREERRRAAFDLMGEDDGDPPGREAFGTGRVVAPAETLDITPRELGRRLVAAWRAAAPTALADEVNLAREYEEAAREEIALRKSRRELPSTVDPHDLAEAGWGVVISRDEHPAVVDGLSPLLDRRKREAGELYQELTYQPGRSARSFLWLDCAESPGVLDPKVLPYYLLIVGGPETIPFEIQYQLAINHAVGRVAFDDVGDYRRYAEAVLEAEDHGTDLPRHATIFSVENDRDRATALLADHLVAPLRERLAGFADWQLEVWEGKRSYKRDLHRLLGGDDTPGLLLASCHGVRMEPEADDQTARQGALLCRDWPGGGHDTAPEHSFSHVDLAEDARVRGLIVYLFACYGAGTPVEDNFPHEAPEGTKVGQPPPARVLAPRPFVARLPQALLGRGALAVVGHVDRGWTTAFQWQFRRISADAVRSLEDSLRQLLGGGRIGHTLRPLVRRYTAIAGQMAVNVERVRNGEPIDEELLAFEWTAHNDARNVLLLGDPAVYLLGRRCWTEALASSGDAGRLRIAPDLLELVTERARAAGMSVEQWVNELVRRQGDEAGGARRDSGDGA